MPAPLPSFMRHGGRLDEAAQRWPDAPRPWLDLSTGINPRPYPTDALAGADHRALPSPAALADLEATAARAFGLRHGAVAAVPGSEIALQLLATLSLPAPYRIVRPYYGTHGAAFPGAERLAAQDVEAVRDGTLMIANPNNPDGRLIPPEALVALARRLGKSGGGLVVDEAFADTLDGAGVLPLLAPDDPVLVLRSFGKFFGLAGVRLGFACGHPATVARLRARLGDWPVSAAAIALGTAAYADERWAARMRGEVRDRAARLDAVLARHGLAASGACPLFRLIATPDAQALFERLGSAGVLVRPFDGAPHWLRLGLPPDDAALDRLDAALDAG